VTVLATWIALLMRWTCRNEKEGTNWKSPWCQIRIDSQGSPKDDADANSRPPEGERLLPPTFLTGLTGREPIRRLPRRNKGLETPELE
jgi:hypothetical protein